MPRKTPNRASFLIQKISERIDDMLVEVKKAGKEERGNGNKPRRGRNVWKEHKNVLRDIETLGCSEEFNQLNFEPIKYRDVKNREQKAYSIKGSDKVQKYLFDIVAHTGPWINDM